MPMIDVYAAEGTFTDRHILARDLAQAVMRWEQVPQIPLFSDNTAAFIHDLLAEGIANAAGASDYVCVQVLTPVGVLDRDKAARRRQGADRDRRRHRPSRARRRLTARGYAR